MKCYLENTEKYNITLYLTDTDGTNTRAHFLSGYSTQVFNSFTRSLRVVTVHRIVYSTPNTWNDPSVAICRAAPFSPPPPTPHMSLSTPRSLPVR